jgi:hypothetical protein
VYGDDCAATVFPTTAKAARPSRHAEGHTRAESDAAHVAIVADTIRLFEDAGDDQDVGIIVSMWTTWQHCVGPHTQCLP